MSAPDITPETLRHFSSLAGEPELTLLLGAGASASVGLPDWDTFAARVAVASKVVPTEDIARQLLAKQDPTIVLEAARKKSGDRWERILRTTLYGDPPRHPEPSSLHLAAVKHFSAAPKRTTLATLNFDTLLEIQLLDEGAPTVVAATDGDTGGGHPTVHHLHGVIDLSRATDPVVTFRDYADLLADSRAWQHDFLSKALARGPLLFAGTSYRDPDIRQWLHLVMRDESPAHPAIVTIVREGLRVDRESFATLESALSLEWEAIGLHALTLHDLADVASVIRELRHMGAGGYRAPSERAARVWQAHARHRRALQGTYARALAADARSIGKAIGASAHRATLWLADARGRLARWATEGTRYDGLRGLKRVPAGFDSPWIAGEALGWEHVLLRDVPREQRVHPTWKSVLAVPIFVDDTRLPYFASAVVTVGLSESATAALANQDTWHPTVAEIGNTWGTRLSAVAFENDSD